MVRMKEEPQVPFLSKVLEFCFCKAEHQPNSTQIKLPRVIVKKQTIIVSLKTINDWLIVFTISLPTISCFI